MKIFLLSATMIILLSLIPLIQEFEYASALALSSSTVSHPFHSFHPSDLSLFPYQEVGCKRLIEDKRLLLADEMGLGKTVQCIEAINRMVIHKTAKKEENLYNISNKHKNCENNNQEDAYDLNDVLIICPKSVLGVWESEIHNWISPNLDYKIELITTSTKSFPRLSFQSKSFNKSSPISFTLINYDLCHKFKNDLQNRFFDILICDEAHYLKSITAKRTEAVFGNIIKKNKKHQQEHNNGIQSHFLWLLTGTPVLNRPVELFPLLHSINADEFGNFKEYTRRYCNPKTINDKRGNYRMDYSGAANLLELKQRLEPFMLRRYKMDVLMQLPEKFRGVTILYPGIVSTATGRTEGNQNYGIHWTEQEKLQQILKSNSGFQNDKHDGNNVGSRVGIPPIERSVDFGVSVEDFGLPTESSMLAKYLGVRHADVDDPDQWNIIMGYISTIRKETALLKVDPAVELLENIMLSEKVVVFAHHREVIEQLVERFGERAVCVMGGMRTDERTEAVQKFQEDENIRIFIGSIRAAGVGLTLTASSNVIFLELDWVSLTSQFACHC